MQQPFAAGSHKPDWNAGRIARGWYFNRMEADGRLIQTYGMVLVS